jgi:hypothetical protein
MNKKQMQDQPGKNTNQLEGLWDHLLSRQPEQIRSAFVALESPQQKAVLAHLHRMLNEDGWQPGQRISARAALKAIGTRPNQDQ